MPLSTTPDEVICVSACVHAYMSVGVVGSAMKLVDLSEHDL